jgi:hypothetical protein
MYNSLESKCINPNWHTNVNMSFHSVHLISLTYSFYLPQESGGYILYQLIKLDLFAIIPLPE